jgi:hypothetical protein
LGQVFSIGLHLVKVWANAVGIAAMIAAVAALVKRMLGR